MKFCKCESTYAYASLGSSCDQITSAITSNEKFYAKRSDDYGKSKKAAGIESSTKKQKVSKDAKPKAQKIGPVPDTGCSSCS